MRMSSAKLGFIAFLAGLAVATSAQAQLPSCCGSGLGCGGRQQCGDPIAATSLPNDGSPDAFSDCNYSCWTEPLVWGNAQYLVGITRRSPLGVPLVTTSNNSTSTGAIGQKGTEVLFGDQGLDLQYPEGMRFTLGLSPTRDWCVPLEVVYTYQHQRTDAFSEQSSANGSPLLARPVFSTTPNNSGETSLVSSDPGLKSGDINIDGSLQLWGIQAVGVVRTDCQWGDDCCGCALYLPVGFRYLNLNEGLNINSSSTAIGADTAVHFLGSTFGEGSQTVVTDIFRSNNEFRGGEFGIRFVTRSDGLCLTLEPRISIGATEQAATIAGVSDLIEANGTKQTAAGGILAVASNSGRFARERFTYLPEGTATLAWQCFPWMGIQAGYNITYWPNVQRPGTEINTNVDLRQVPTSAAFNSSVTSTSPSFFFKDSTFWMQDVSIGVVFSY
jgi:Putative beta barrel porin-7 (BBP7)